MRIFHGLQNICGIPGVMARAQRKLGYRAEAWCHPVPNVAFSVDHTIGWDRAERRSLLLKSLTRFDVLQFYFGQSFAGPGLLDVPWLRRMGKRIAFYFCGCDARDSKFTVSNYPISACAVCWPQLCSANQVVAREVAAHYAHVIFACTPDLMEFLDGSILLPQPLELDLVDQLAARGPGKPPGRPGIDRPVRIAHAPSSQAIKGSARVVEAVHNLAKQGWPVELVLIENVPHDRVLSICATCDMAIDQILIGAYGQFSAEMMALGIPTFCYIRDDLYARYPPELPVISVSPLNLEQVLSEWLDHPQWWADRGRAGRHYVEKYHESQVVAQKSLAAYKPQRWWGRRRN